jgi:hypothetical protein
VRSYLFGVRDFAMLRPMGDRPDLLASDAERERAVARLRRGVATGRLTVDELDERSARAYAARTRGELDALVGDLPGHGSALDAPASRPPVDTGGLGRQPFTFVFEYPVAPAQAIDAALQTMVPALARAGYELAGRDHRRLVFDFAYRPGWVVLPVLALPIVGLLALAVKEHDRVSVDFEDGSHGGTRMVISGRAPRRVRRAFAELGPES